MILQALVQNYEDLVARGEIDQPGWSPVKVSFALELDEQGEILQVVDLRENHTSGKKTVLLPRELRVPAPVKRSSGVVPNFLCDNSAYFLGIDNKGPEKAQRARQCFQASRTLHEELLAQTNTPAAQALLAYFRRWDPETAGECPALQEKLEEILAGGNLVFRYQGRFLHEEEALRRVWQDRWEASEEGEKRICLVTGKLAPVAQLHPNIKGISGAQSSGASLVSFNAPAFCSFDREQGMNAPTSQYAAFAYGAALNHLIADRDHVQRIGDTTILCWAEGGEPAYQSFLGGVLFGQEFSYSQSDLREMTARLCRGLPVEFDQARLEPERPFYVLGLSPNAARLSVRFFFRNSFGDLVRNVQAHQQRLEIVRPSYDPFETLPLGRLLGETVNQNTRDKAVSPELAGEMLRAILNNTRYPAQLLNGVVLRIRAEHQVTRGRAAIIKAYYTQNQGLPKEVLTVSLNPTCREPAYVLGRLFSILEDIQSAANPGLNATIKDKYFNSASATPAMVFPTLMNLAQKHLRKLTPGQRVRFEKQLGEVTNLLDTAYPVRLNLPQQGGFQLGYYHQTQSRYQKNTGEKTNPAADCGSVEDETL